MPSRILSILDANMFKTSNCHPIHLSKSKCVICYFQTFLLKLSQFQKIREINTGLLYQGLDQSIKGFFMFVVLWNSTIKLILLQSSAPLQFWVCIPSIGNRVLRSGMLLYLHFTSSKIFFILQMTTSKMRQFQTRILSQFHRAKYLLDWKLVV